MSEVKCYRGEGGALFELAHPLAAVYADQVRRGQLIEVPDGAGDAAVPVAVTEPAKTDPKAAWVDYAVASGATRADAEQVTKPELITLYGGT